MATQRLHLEVRKEDLAYAIRSRRKMIVIILLVTAELAAMMGTYASFLIIEGAWDNTMKYRNHFGIYHPGELHYLLSMIGVCALCALTAYYLPRHIFGVGRKRIRYETTSTPGFEKLTPTKG